MPMLWSFDYMAHGANKEERSTFFASSLQNLELQVQVLYRTTVPTIQMGWVTPR
jgi:hypothetical protein